MTPTTGLRRRDAGVAAPRGRGADRSAAARSGGLGGGPRAARSRSACSRALKNLLIAAPHQKSPRAAWSEDPRAGPRARTARRSPAEGGHATAAAPTPRTAGRAGAGPPGGHPSRGPGSAYAGPRPALRPRGTRIASSTVSPVEAPLLVGIADQEGVVAERIDDPRDTARVGRDPGDRLGGEEVEVPRRPRSAGGSGCTPRISSGGEGADPAPEGDPLLELRGAPGSVQARPELGLADEEDLEELLASGSRSSRGAGSARASPGRGSGPRRG